MRAIITAIFLLFIAFSNVLIAQGIEFEHNPWAETLAKAEKSGKLIFLDAYASWCGPCKMLARNTFTDANVGKFFNKNFVAAKIDMETGEGPELAQKYGVQAYPTLLFINGKGELVHRGVGYMTPEQLLELGQNALNPETQMGAMLKRYDAGDRKPANVLALLNTLEAANDQRAVPIANAYLDTQTDFSDPTTLNLILRFANNPKAPCFAYLMKKQDVLAKELGQEEFNQKIEEIYTRYLFNNQETEMAEMDKLIQSTYKGGDAGNFIAKFHVAYYAQNNDPELFLNAVTTLLTKYPSNNSEELNSYAWAFHEITDDAIHLKNALKWAKKSVELSEQYANTDTLAVLYGELGDKKEAKKQAVRAIELAKKSGEDYSSTQAFLDSLK
ncbi:MAG: thioredoxin fold domain-containing protein [Bacteroidetes bacterium]|nr:thioredoxin fold domain-containing protein [Bacteroidota bacterium]